MPTDKRPVTLLDEFALRLVHTGIDKQAFASDCAAVARATGRLQEDVTVADVVAFRAYNMAEAMMTEKLRREKSVPPAASPARPPAPSRATAAGPIPLEELGLPWNAAKGLRALGIRTSDELARLTREELLLVRGIGRATQSDVVFCLLERGLRPAETSTGALDEFLEAKRRREGS